MLLHCCLAQALLLAILLARASLSIAAVLPAPTEVRSWPGPEQCRELAQHHGGKTSGEYLEEQAEVALSRVHDDARLTERLQELQAFKRFQEILWLIDDAGYYQEALTLEEALYCFLLDAHFA
jgi:hypothetical protein